MPRKSPANSNQKPTAVADVLAGLPESRRREFERVLQVIRKHLPAGYEETVNASPELRARAAGGIPGQRQEVGNG